MVSYDSHGQGLIDNGFSIIPIQPLSKKPVINNWSSLIESPPPVQYHGCGIGIRCGLGDDPVYAIDIDIMDKEISGEMQKYVGARIRRFGQRPKCLYLFRSDTGGIRKKKSKKYSVGHVEVLGFGQYFVGFGIHEKTREPYRWVGLKSISELRYEDLPVITESEMGGIIEYFEDLMDTLGYELVHKENTKQNNSEDYVFEDGNDLFAKKPIGMKHEEIKNILARLDPDCSRDQWRNVGFAIHHETEGSIEGFELWNCWSSEGSKYNEDEMEYQWNSFGKTYSNEPIAAPYLKKLFNEWKETQTEKEEDKVIREMLDGANEDGKFFDSLNWSVERFSYDVPPREMLIYGLVPKGIVGMLYADGGVGKSTVVLLMAIKIALAKKYEAFDFFGRTINGGKAVIVTAEDPDDEINRRYVSILKCLSEEYSIAYDVMHEQLKDTLFIPSTFGIPVTLLELKNDKSSIKATMYYKSLFDKLASMEDLSLVVIDTRTRFSQAEEGGNVVATQEVTYYEAIAKKTKATVLILHHTPKSARNGTQSGAQAYRGVTGLYDTIRAAWYYRPVNALEIEQEGIQENEAIDYSVFENAKNNYMRKHNPILIHRKGFSYTHKDLSEATPKGERVDQKKQGLIDAIVLWMQQSKNSAFIQADVVTVGKDELKAGRSRVVAALTAAEEDGLISVNDHGHGKTKTFSLTEAGKAYNLMMD